MMTPLLVPAGSWTEQEVGEADEQIIVAIVCDYGERYISTALWEPFRD